MEIFIVKPQKPRHGGMKVTELKMIGQDKQIDNPFGFYQQSRDNT